MASLNPAQAISVAQRVEQLCDFFGHSAVQKALEDIPVSMPPDFGSLGFDRALWVGLGIVGLWAALDAFYERAGLIATKCAVCKRKRCIRARFANYCEGDSTIMPETDTRSRHGTGHRKGSAHPGMGINAAHGKC
jgi:hypothetical protein